MLADIEPREPEPGAHTLGETDVVRWPIRQIREASCRQQSVVEQQHLSRSQGPRLVLVRDVHRSTPRRRVQTPPSSQKGSEILVTAGGFVKSTGREIVQYRTNPDRDPALHTARTRPAGACRPGRAPGRQDAPARTRASARSGTAGRVPPCAPSTTASRDASRLRNTTPCRPVASTEYSRTLVSQKVPKYGIAGPFPIPAPTIRNGTNATGVRPANGPAGRTSGIAPAGRCLATSAGGTNQCRKARSHQNWLITGKDVNGGARTSMPVTTDPRSRETRGHDRPDRGTRRNPRSVRLTLRCNDSPTTSRGNRRTSAGSATWASRRANGAPRQ